MGPVISIIKKYSPQAVFIWRSDFEKHCLWGESILSAAPFWTPKQRAFLFVEKPGHEGYMFPFEMVPTSAFVVQKWDYFSEVRKISFYD